jgi:hypothetical protein
MKVSKWAGVAALGLAAIGGPAKAGVVIDMSEIGGNVVVTGSGTVDLTGLSFSRSGFTEGFLFASLGDVAVGSVANDDLYSGAAGPASFGVGGFRSATGQSGDIVGVINASEVVVPRATCLEPRSRAPRLMLARPSPL